MRQNSAACARAHAEHGNTVVARREQVGRKIEGFTRDSACKGHSRVEVDRTRGNCRRAATNRTVVLAAIIAPVGGRDGALIGPRKSVTKADIVNKIAEETGLTKVETKTVVEGMFQFIIDTVATGERIELRGFGVFNSKSRKPRMARNPKTGEEVPLDKRFVPVFKPSPEFTSKVNDSLLD